MSRRSTLLCAGLLLLTLLGSGLAQETDIAVEDGFPVTLGAQPDAVIRTMVPLDLTGTSGEDVPDLMEYPDAGPQSASEDPSVEAAYTAPEEEGSPDQEEPIKYYMTGVSTGTQLPEEVLEDETPESYPQQKEEEPPTTEETPEPVSYTKGPEEPATDGRVYKTTSGQQPSRPLPPRFKPHVPKPTAMPRRTVNRPHPHSQKLPKGVLLPSDQTHVKDHHKADDEEDTTYTAPEQDAPDSSTPYDTTQDQPAPQDPAAEGRKYKHTSKPQQTRQTRRGPAQPSQSKPTDRKTPVQPHLKPTKGTKHSKEQARKTSGGKHTAQPLPDQAQVDASTAADQTVPQVPVQPTTQRPVAGSQKVPKPVRQTGKGECQTSSHGCGTVCQARRAAHLSVHFLEPAAFHTRITT
jgi:hypothetical protein